MAEHEVELTVDGEAASVAVEPRTLLVHAIRDQLGVTAPKIGCETGKCGACTVTLDGTLVKSCMLLAVQAEGGTVRTAAGMADGDELHPIQQAFRATHGLQCGYCTPGMLLAAERLLADQPNPSRAEIRSALKGNICRCTGYQHIVDAIERAAADAGGAP